MKLIGVGGMMNEERCECGRVSRRMSGDEMILMDGDRRMDEVSVDKI